MCRCAPGPSPCPSTGTTPRPSSGRSPGRSRRTSARAGCAPASASPGRAPSPACSTSTGTPWPPPTRSWPRRAGWTRRRAAVRSCRRRSPPRRRRARPSPGPWGRPAPATTSRRARVRPGRGPAPAAPSTSRAGIPDLRLVPAAELARAYRRALRRPGILGYANPRGQPALRAALGAMLRSTRGLDPDPDRLLVARGSQHAITLAARALVRPGDAVAVEALGYPAAWEAFRAAGARLVPSRSTGTGSASTRWRRPRAGSRCARSTSRRTTSTRPPRRSPPAGGSRSSASRPPRGSRSSRTTSTASSTTTGGRCCPSRRATRPAWSCTWGRSRRCSRRASGSATCTRPWS